MATEKLTKEEIESKAESLSKIHGVTVRPLIFIEDETGEQIVGFVKDPSRLVKIRVLDKALTSQMTAASELLDLVIISEESDPRIMSEKPENDKYYLGAVMASMNVIKFSVDTYKKK